MERFGAAGLAWAPSDVVSEHQRRLQHMLNWQFEPLLCCVCSKSLTCNVHSKPRAHKNHSYPAITFKQLWATLAPAVRQRASAFCPGWTPCPVLLCELLAPLHSGSFLAAFSWDLAAFQAWLVFVSATHSERGRKGGRAGWWELLTACKTCLFNSTPVLPLCWSQMRCSSSLMHAAFMTRIERNHFIMPHFSILSVDVWDSNELPI